MLRKILRWESNESKIRKAGANLREVSRWSHVVSLCVRVCLCTCGNPKTRCARSTRDRTMHSVFKILYGLSLAEILQNCSIGRCCCRVSLGRYRWMERETRYRNLLDSVSTRKMRRNMTTLQMALAVATVPRHPLPFSRASCSNVPYRHNPAAHYHNSNCDS